jgi:hypothetical protein
LKEKLKTLDGRFWAIIMLVLAQISIALLK